MTNNKSIKMFNYKFNKIKLVKNPFITCLIIIMLIDDSKQNRSKRFLLFPRTSPTRVQVSIFIFSVSHII